MAQLARAEDRCVRCAGAAARAWEAGGASEALREQSRCTSNLEVICFETSLRVESNASKPHCGYKVSKNVMKDMSKHPLYIESFF